MNSQSPYAIAESRVNQTPELDTYRDLLLESDWDAGDDHFEWVATAELAELLDWCDEIRQAEEAEAAQVA